MTVTRRQFMKVSAAGLAASSVGALGFGSAGEALAAGVRPYKLERATETRNTCPYCSVSCGVIMYTMGDTAKNNKPALVHVEGDPDHPVNRGTLCPKGAGVMDMIQSPNRLKQPCIRKSPSRQARSSATSSRVCWVPRPRCGTTSPAASCTPPATRSWVAPRT